MDNIIKSITVLCGNGTKEFSIGKNRVSRIEDECQTMPGGEYHKLYSGYDEKGNRIFDIEDCPVIIEYAPNGSFVDDSSCIDEIDFGENSERIINALRFSKHFDSPSNPITISQVCALRKKDIRKIRNLGKISLRVLEEGLAKHGYSLKK